MEADEYLKLAQRTMVIHTSKGERLTNAALGLAGEGGEVADMVKKWLFHGHTLDEAKLKLELGDLQWYIAQAATALGLTLSEIMEANIEKLERRYAKDKGFTYEQSINREEYKNAH